MTAVGKTTASQLKPGDTILVTQVNGFNGPGLVLVPSVRKTDQLIATVTDIQPGPPRRLVVTTDRGALIVPGHHTFITGFDPTKNEGTS